MTLERDGLVAHALWSSIFRGLPVAASHFHESDREGGRDVP